MQRDSRDSWTGPEDTVSVRTSQAIREPRGAHGCTEGSHSLCFRGWVGGGGRQAALSDRTRA